MSLSKLCSFHSTVVLALFALVSTATGQQSYLVSDFNNSNVDVVRLSDNALLETLPVGANPQGVAVSPNGRLAFVANVNSAYMSVVDLTIRREIKRIYGVRGRNVAISADGTRVVVPGIDGNVYVINTATLQIIKIVSMAAVYGTGLDTMGSAVIVGGKAYVNSSGIGSAGPVAVVNLTAGTATAVPSSTGSGSRRAGIAATPDGKYVLAAQPSAFQVLLIATATSTVASTIPISPIPRGLAIARHPAASNTYAYIILGAKISAIDLRAGSATFGQWMNSAVASLPFANPASLSVSDDGTRLVVSASSGSPDVAVLDTSLLLSNPSSAVISQTTVGGATAGLQNSAVAQINTVVPVTAPVVAGVSGNAVNSAPTTLQISGSNFVSGAMVKFGSLDPVLATFVSSTSLQAKVPQYAPAQSAADIIVTNPNASSPVASQQQSGLLTGRLTIYNSAAYQPQNSFVTSNQASSTVSLFNPGTGFTGLYSGLTQLPLLAAFMPDGSRVYFLTASGTVVQSFNLKTKVFESPIQLGGQGYGIAASKDPSTGKPIVIATSVISNTFAFDPDLVVIDANPLSATFNTVLSTIPANLNDSGEGYGLGVTPDGVYAYTADFAGDLLIFDIQHSDVTTVSLSSLGVSLLQISVYVTPDGKSLLMRDDSGAIKVFDISVSRTAPTLVTTITGSTPTGLLAPQFQYYQVRGSRLFAFDPNQYIVESFNFDIAGNNFSQTGSFVIPAHQSLQVNMDLDPKGTLLYVAMGSNDAVAVLDANLLATGNTKPLLTEIHTGISPNAVAINPVSQASAGTITTPVPGSKLAGSSVTFNWRAGVGIKSYTLSVGTTPGAHDIAQVNAGTAHSALVSGLPVNGEAVYVTLGSYTGTTTLTKAYVYAAAGAGTAGVITSPAAGKLTGSSATFMWSAGTGISGYTLYLGTAPGTHNIATVNAGTATSTTINTLPTNGETIYATLYSLNGFTQLSNAVQYYASGSGTAAVLLSPAPASKLTGSSVVFTWSTGSGISDYVLYIGTAAGASDISNIDAGTATSTTVTGLPTNGEKLYVTLRSLNGANWLSKSYVLYATGTAAAIGPPGSNAGSD